MPAILGALCSPTVISGAAAHHVTEKHANEEIPLIYPSSPRPRMKTRDALILHFYTFTSTFNMAITLHRMTDMYFFTPP